MAEETIFYREDNVLVTNIRCVIDTEVIAIRSVTSVQGTRIRRDYAIPGALIIFGALLFLVLFGADEKIWSSVGVIMIVAGIFLAILKKRPFAVVICMTSGEVIRYRSNDRDDITKIIAALNEAIIAQEGGMDETDSPEDEQEVVDGEEAVEGQEDQGEQKKAD